VLQLVLSSVRFRLVSFIRAFLAGSLAVTIVAAVGLLIDGRSRAHVLVPTDLRAVSLIVQPSMQTAQGGMSRTEPPTTAPGQAQTRRRSGFTSPRLPASLLDQVRAEPGVRSAAGDLAFLAQTLDRRDQPLAAPPDVPDQARPWSSAALTPSAGRAPSGAAEVAVDGALAKRGGFQVGDRIRVRPGRTLDRRFTDPGRSRNRWDDFRMTVVPPAYTPSTRGRKGTSMAE
jgi:putative ABC transport system permease protein